MDQTKHILKKLVAFSVPLILSGLLQQLFNWVDALIVGNVAGENAIAGIGATTSLYNLFVTAIIGFTSGLSVLFAQQFGRGENSENRKLLAAYVRILCIVFTVIAAFGIAFSSPILNMMNTPDPLFVYAKDYLSVVLAGVPFLAVYNTYSAALRGIGNSKVPFIAVLISSVTNGILDLVFVVGCDLGVMGAAAATVISQAAMTVYIIVYTVKNYPELRFSLFCLEKTSITAENGAKFAFPPAIQSSVSSLGNIFLQRFMNSFGEQTVAAVTTAYRVDTVLLLPIVNFSTAISTLAAQEKGAGNEAKAKKVFRLGVVMMSVMSLLLTAVIIFCGKYLLAMFGLTAESVDIGSRFFTTIAMFYVIYGISMSIKGFLEGMSDMVFSGAVGICSLGVRIACSYIFAGAFGNMVIAYAEAFSWIFMFIVFTFRYFRKTKQIKTSVKE